MTLYDTHGKLLLDDVPSLFNLYQASEVSAEIAALNTTTISDIAYPDKEKRPPIEQLTIMAERDPVAAGCLALLGMRAVLGFGNYTHNRKEIENFINSNLQTLNKSFKRVLFKLITSTILYGAGIAEFTVSAQTRGHYGEWRVSRINVLDPTRIKKFSGSRGRIDYIVYDNGDGKETKIPYVSCIHIVNNKGVNFDEREVWGVGSGVAALSYYNLKKVVLTQLALATKNNSTGLVHAKVPNNGRTIMVDSKLQPIKGTDGKPIETSKQVALTKQLQDLYKRDYIVTDIDVDINRIQIQNDHTFWEYILNYIDRNIQMSFGIPTGILDSGMSSVQNIGLGKNYKSVFDSTIFSLTTLLKEELIKKVIKRLLYWNFPYDWFKNNYGEFVYDVEEDPEAANARLSTISSLVASGLLDANDIEVLGLLRKNLGLPALNEEQRTEKQEDQMNAKIKAEIQSQLEQMQLEMQMQQMQQPPAPPEGAEGEAPTA